MQDGGGDSILGHGTAAPGSSWCRAAVSQALGRYCKEEMQREVTDNICFLGRESAVLPREATARKQTRSCQSWERNSRAASSIPRICQVSVLGLSLALAA